MYKSVGHSQLEHWMQVWSPLLKKDTAEVEKREGQQGWQNEDGREGDMSLGRNNRGKAWQEMHRMMSNEQRGEGSTGLHSNSF